MPSVRTLNISFSEDIFRKLRKEKEKSGAKSWEEWILKVAGLEPS